jgi:aspartate aminotransferase/aminotransferase
MDASKFIAERIAAMKTSGIRRIFDLAATLKDPIDFSMGQPDFPVPEPVKATAVAGIGENRNGYVVTYGIPELRNKITAGLQAEFGWKEPRPDWTTLVTSGVSGGINLFMLAVLNPGDEVILPDPCFVSYGHVVRLAGGVPVFVDTSPNFVLDPAKVEKAITPRTKAIMLNSPSNPTGVVYPRECVEGLCALAERRNLLLLSDEIYNKLAFDGRPSSPVDFAPHRTILLRGFGKSYGMTGWRMGYAAGPTPILTEMAKVQQYTFVCTPQPFQRACITALDLDVSDVVVAYRHKRDLARSILASRFDFPVPGGGFFIYCLTPKKYPNATAFVEAAITRNVLVVPGSAFSNSDTHFRISFAVSNEKLERGCRILCELAE